MPVFVAGGILVVLALLGGQYPHLLAGYISMSNKQKKRVNWKGLSRFTRRWWTIGALCLPLVYGVFRQSGLAAVQAYSACFGCLILASLAFNIFAGRYNHNSYDR